MTRKIQGSVVVITGASSGIGRATALAFTRHGAKVVLAARNEQPLHEVASQCAGLGAETLVVPTDVTDEASVKELARRAVERFGRLDIWVNNAAVTGFGFFEDTPPDVFRRIIDTNFFGYVHGARAALPLFREQGSGVLINNASMVARMSEPYVSAYVASKHAIRGLSQSLRQELAVKKARDIHVCVVMPATIDTPFFQHAANYSGRAAKAMPPVYPAERVARAIVHMAQWPRRELFVGNSARQFNLLSFVAPGLAERLMARMVDRQHLYQDVPAFPTPGNLFQPSRHGAESSGGWMPHGLTRLRRSALRTTLTAVPAVLGLWWLRTRLLTRLPSAS
ncbi:short-chain dehydrogenase [Archangium sp. Cb G35]|uniref:SDR family oxidoreductase n=1 Tax=Archangium sp. Cb G35 TaxID=1920190 RepID=UPI000935E0F3|nr:SDR family oxidoreductase [Archangium sp. Cb G35]OJT25016.1 short-chain dehydrogenase [Archangium sp. Cb G35]